MDLKMRPGSVFSIIGINKAFSNLWFFSQIGSLGNGNPVSENVRGTLTAVSRFTVFDE